MMALPLARSSKEGGSGPGAFVTMVTQAQLPQHILITSAEDFKQQGAGASPHAVATLYAELQETKGVVLGRVDVVGASEFSKDTAARFVEELAGMYLADDRFDHVLKFNKQPDRFDFGAVCALFGCQLQ